MPKGWRKGRFDDDVVYGSIHLRLKNERGPASSHPCVDCGKQARDWSYKHGGGGMPHSANMDDYEPRCRKCHIALDAPAVRPIVTCSEDDCERVHYAKGRCKKHYWRWCRQNGSKW